MGGVGRLLFGLRSNSTERGTNLLELRYERCSVRSRSVPYLDKPSDDPDLQVTVHCPVLFVDVVERIERRSGLLGFTLFLLRDGTRVTANRARDAVRRPSCGLVDKGAVH